MIQSLQYFSCQLRLPDLHHQFRRVFTHAQLHQHTATVTAGPHDPDAVQRTSKQQFHTFAAAFRQFSSLSPTKFVKLFRVPQGAPTRCDDAHPSVPQFNVGHVFMHQKSVAIKGNVVFGHEFFLATVPEES
jgi:hypothetical protein